MIRAYVASSHSVEDALRPRVKARRVAPGGREGDSLISGATFISVFPPLDPLFSDRESANA